MLGIQAKRHVGPSKADFVTCSTCFVHASALDRVGITGLTEGQRVAVDVIDGRKGPEAAGLRLI